MKKDASALAFDRSRAVEVAPHVGAGAPFRNQHAGPATDPTRWFVRSSVRGPPQPRGSKLPTRFGCWPSLVGNHHGIVRPLAPSSWRTKLLLLP